MSRVINWLRGLFSSDVPTPGRPGSMSLEERRKLYACGDAFKTLLDIPSWKDYYELHKARLEPQARQIVALSTPHAYFNEVVSIWCGDITALEVDVIVNPACDTLLGGGGIDADIHKAAGPKLKAKCRTLNGCRPGHSKMTSGFNLPANYVIHTVPPRDRNTIQMKGCYESSLNLAAEKCYRVIAFPSLRCGRYAFSIEEAAPLAAATLKSWFVARNCDDFARVIFVAKDEDDLRVYETALLMYFPMPSED